MIILCTALRYRGEVQEHALPGADSGNPRARAARRHARAVRHRVRGLGLSHHHAAGATEGYRHQPRWVLSP